MNYPVTFKASAVESIIENWIDTNYYDVDPNYSMNDMETSYKFSFVTWYGMLIDTLITITQCT